MSRSTDRSARRLALTPELVALTMRKVEDPGPTAGIPQMNDADFAELAAALLENAPREVWVFAYGSLIWNPSFTAVEQRVGTVRGWHRTFRLKITRWRGTNDLPGLMMGLDRGGQCTGMLYRLDSERIPEEIGKLLRREMSAKPPSNMPRWLRVHSDGIAIPAIGFVMNRLGRAYAGPHTDDETADVLARACGHVGSCAEYLHNTVAKLAEHGIYDRNLWRLQAMVAERIGELHKQAPRR